MMTPRLAIACLLPLLLSGATASSAEERFERRVRPILVKRCYGCHAQTKMGGLSMDSREALLGGGTRGPAIVPGDPAASLLLKAVRYQDRKLEMPPGAPLPSGEIEEIAEWIREGASWPKPVTAGLGTKHWAFQPVRPPATRGIDRLITAKLAGRGLRMAPPADPRTWLRRVTFDLTGLPPSPDEMRAFLAAPLPEARREAVDRLLASPRYGERWARYWLDIVRYADEVVYGQQPQFHHYRDWVVRALNDDMPYDRFLRAQLAADLIPDMKDHLAALTPFVDPSTEFNDDDRVDVLGRGFLGLTVGCAQCHDHKYDPIPTKDYYSLLGIFKSTQYREIPLAEAAAVERYRKAKDRADEQEKEIREFLATEQRHVAEMLVRQSSKYLMAAWRVLGPRHEPVEMQDAQLDRETLDRWISYLPKSPKQHPFLRRFEKLMAEGAPDTEASKEAVAFELLAIEVFREKRAVDEFNNVLKFGAKTGRELGDVVGKTMSRDRFMLWQELAADGNPRASDAQPDAREDGVLTYRGDKVLRFLPARYADHVRDMREHARLSKTALPRPYPFLTAIEDSPKPANLRVFLRGNPQNLGEEAPRGFLTVLKHLAPEPFRQGSGRLELAAAITDARNPLTARVMVNRVWERHFGAGLVRTPSNFGSTGDRPALPELLDDLAARFVENGWSLKKLHREIVLSEAYSASATVIPANQESDPENRLHWRYPRRRLDPEALRDSLLYVAGSLEDKSGGAPLDLESPENRRRTLYGKISRQRLDPMLVTFDFPNPNQTSEQRVQTTVPLQRLFLLNGDFMMRRAAELAARAGTMQDLYRIVFQREPSASERRAGEAFLANGDRAAYCQVLLASNEFLYVE